MEGDEKGYWKSVSEVTVSDPDVKAKRRVTRFRETPHYFLPKSSLPRTIAYYSAWTAAGIAAGIATEIWVKKKIKEDGDIIWDFEK